MEGHPGSRLYRASWLFLTGIVTISCAFSDSCSLLQILRSSSRCHSVLMLLSLSSVTNLSLLFGFCAACSRANSFEKKESLPQRCVCVGSDQALRLLCLKGHRRARECHHKNIFLREFSSKKIAKKTRKCYLRLEREIILFIGKLIGRSLMISRLATNVKFRKIYGWRLHLYS